MNTKLPGIAEKYMSLKTIEDKIKMIWTAPVIQVGIKNPQKNEKKTQSLKEKDKWHKRTERQIDSCLYNVGLFQKFMMDNSEPDFGKSEGDSRRFRDLGNNYFKVSFFLIN